VRIGDADGVTHARGDVSGPVTWSRELIVGEQEHGALFVHANSASTTDHDEDEAFFGLAADRLALLVAEHGALFAAQSRATEQDFLSEATDLLAGSSSVFLSLTLLTQIVVPRLADWCAVLSVDDRHRARRVTANHRHEDRTDAVNDALTADRDLRQAIRDAAHGRPAHRLPTTVSIAGQRTQVVVLPLASRGRTLGVLVLGRAEAMDPMLFMATLELARRAAVAVDNARLHEEQAETAAALQKSLLPSALPVIDGIELAARYHSASPGMEVGGDFYDAVSLVDGSTVFAIGDVCGKGAEAATVTGTSRDLLRLLAQDGVAPAQALRRLNKALLDHPSSTRFCTIALAQVMRDGESVHARVCLAGHPEPVLLKADGTTELVGHPGDLLGVLSDEHLDLNEVEAELAVGDSLVLYTDGITERREGTRMYGQRGLRKTLERSAGLNAERLAEAVESAAASFVDSELRDDLAILVIRRND
jgi:serine phosphatase RsbU (regulator of sigma subunit)